MREQRRKLPAPQIHHLHSVVSQKREIEAVAQDLQLCRQADRDWRWEEPGLRLHFEKLQPANRLGAVQQRPIEVAGVPQTEAFEVSERLQICEQSVAGVVFCGALKSPHC